MRVSRAGVIVALLLVTIFMFYMMLLGATVLRAQETMMGETTTGETTTGGTTEETTGGESTSDGACPSAEVVATFRASPGEDLIDQTFEVSGDRFRVSLEDEGTGFASVGITINDEDGDFVDSFVAGSEQQRSSLVVNQGPGSFSLETIADTDDGYTVTVEDCAGSNQGDTNGDEDTDNDGVIDNTIPRKPLPDTGGSTALMVGGTAMLLLYGGLVAWRLKTRGR